jgi:steroid 5-alpha reductase family enzyme
MSLLSLSGIGFLVILGCMAALWLLSLYLKNSSIVDIFWGTGFVIVNWVYFALAPDGFLPRQWLIGILVTIWGLRLTTHILTRNWGKGEDFRYRKWITVMGHLRPLIGRTIQRRAGPVDRDRRGRRCSLGGRLLLRIRRRYAIGPLQG